MTVEHKTIPNGEQHVIANWVVLTGGVAALAGLSVTDDDIGKVAWVSGAGHYVLAATSPLVWESLGVTITEATFDTETHILSISLSDGSVRDVEITPEIDVDAVNTLISEALVGYATQSYVTGQIDSLATAVSNTFSSLTTASVLDSSNRRYVSDAQLVVIGNTSGTNSGDETQASIKTKLGAASGSQDGYLTSADWSTFNSKQAALADVITAGAYGNSTQWPVVTVSAKGIVTSITLQTVPTPTLTDATFSVQKAGSPSITASWSLTAFTASRVHTYPDKAINFGDLPSIASTDSNVLSGTRTRILGGSGSAVSGTDNIAIGCKDVVLGSTETSATRVTASNVSYNSNIGGMWPFPKGTNVLGSSLSPNTILSTFLFGASLVGATFAYTELRPAGGTSNVTIDGLDTTSATNCIKAVAGTTAHGAATHEVEFIVAVGTDNGSGSVLVRRHVYGKRKVFVNRDQSGAFTSTVITLDADQALGDAATGSITLGVTVDTTNNRLVPTVAATSGSNQTHFGASVVIVSHYNRK